MIAPSRKTRGGISAVLHAYTLADFWEQWDTYWLGTHIDRSIWHKYVFAFKAYAQFAVIVHRYSIIHIHFSEPPSAARKTCFFIPALLLRKKVILHFHSFSTETTINSRFRPLYRFLFNRAHRIIVLSDTWKRDVSTVTNNPNIEVVYNPAPPHGEPKPGTTRQQTILFAGTLNERKGFKDLIRAFASISAKAPGWKLILAGNGEIAEGKKLAEEMGIADRTVFTGWISGPDKEAVFHEAGIFCLPSYAEGFPMAVIDAISYGIPTVTTPVGGVLDVLVPDQEILTFTPGDQQALAQKLLQLTESGDLRNKLAENALKKTSKLFDLNEIGKQLSRIYHELLLRN
jgi:glycosyltransferase involved in cell wall biosynthesis